MTTTAALPSDLSTTGQPRRKRCRITFSCTNCRRGKQRCDREKPCRTCVIRGKSETCQYEEVIIEPKDNLASSENGLIGETPRQNDNSAPPGQSLIQFGYSNLYAHNALAIMKKLERYEIGTKVTDLAPRDAAVLLPRRHREEYKVIVRKLPCRDCILALAAVFFAEFNWLYSLLDESIFGDELRDFNQRSFDDSLQFRDDLDLESLRFPVLLFHVIAVALLFLPSVYDPCLDEHACIDASRSDGGKYFNDLGVRLWSLFEKGATSLLTVQASFLKVCWLKNSGRIVESWHSLAQVAMDAQEIGLHRERGRIEAADAQSACAQAWSIVMQRRLMINLFIWETQMALTLGKSINLALDDFNLFPPTDTAISTKRTVTLPSPRGEFDKPNSFTARLIEYRLQANLSRIIALEAEGPFPKSFAKVDKLHQEALTFIENLPPIYRFENPDTSYDAEFTYLPAQREYLCIVTWLFVLLLHRTYLFSNPKSRTEIIKASINLLRSLQRADRHLHPNQRRFFALSFFGVEASVSTLAILIAYPRENGVILLQALQLVKETYERLTAMRDSNGFAGPGADVIRPLLGRAEKVHPIASLRNSQIVDGQTIIQQTNSGAIADNSSAPETSRDKDPTSNGFYNMQSASFEPNPLAMGSFDEVAYGCLAVPLHPTADVLYNDLCPAERQYPTAQGVVDGPSIENDIGEAEPNEIPQQFTGTFGQHSFWNFLNEGL